MFAIVKLNPIIKLCFFSAELPVGHSRAKFRWKTHHVDSRRPPMDREPWNERSEDCLYIAMLRMLYIYSDRYIDMFLYVYVCVYIYVYMFLYMYVYV